MPIHKIRTQRILMCPNDVEIRFQRMKSYFDATWAWRITVRCRYNAVIFLPNRPNRQPTGELWGDFCVAFHYNDVKMAAIASEITSLTIVFLNRLFRRRSKKTSKLRVTGLCVGNSPGTGKFPAQMTSYAENVSI